MLRDERFHLSLILPLSPNNPHHPLISPLPQSNKHRYINQNLQPGTKTNPNHNKTLFI